MTLITQSGGLVGSGNRGRLGSNRIQKPYGFINNAPELDTTDLATLPPDCDNVERLLGTLAVQYFTVQSQGIGGATADIPVTLPLTTQFIMLVAASKLTDSCFMHFQPIGKGYNGGNVITPVGNEPWLPFCQQTSSLSKIGIFYRFKKPMPPIIYFDLGQESGTQNWNTFVVGDDVDEIGSMFAQI